jgi:type II secretory pathway component PulF
MPLAAILILLLCAYLAASIVIRLRPQRSDLFVEYLATLTRKRLPLEEGLHAYAVDQPFGLRRAIFLAIDKLQEGSSLADALEAQSRRPHPFLRHLMAPGFAGGSFSLSASKVFPDRLVALIRVGQESGMLPELLDSYVKQNRSSATNAAKVVGAGVYPGGVLLLIVPILSLVMIKIVPQFQAMFEESELNFPPVTQALITVCEVISSHSWLALFIPILIEASLIVFLGFDPPAMNRKGVPLFLGVALLFLVGVDFLNSSQAYGLFFLFYIYVFVQVSRALLWEVSSAISPPRPRIVYRQLSGIAGRGPRLRSVATFCETFATLLEAGIGTAQALPMACRAAAVDRHDDAMQRVEHAVNEGEGLSEVINRELALSGTASWVLSAANGSHHFPKALRQVSERCLEACEKRLKQMCNIVMPVFLLMVSAAICFVCVALFSALISLTARLGG